MTNLTDYDILVSVQSELDKLKKDYTALTLENLRMKELLKQCKEYLESINTDSDEDSEINDLIFCIRNCR